MAWTTNLALQALQGDMEQTGPGATGAKSTSSDQHGHIEGLHELYSLAVALQRQVEAAQAVTSQGVSPCTWQALA